jgi:antitoxin YefM
VRNTAFKDGSRRQKAISYNQQKREGVIMDAIYHVKADELDQVFLDTLKALFKDKEIEIVVSERDETAYLLRSPANRERLLRAIADVEKSQNIITAEQEQFQ